MMEKRTILYIAGDGHSGSTLLDILLGSQKRAFSAGELLFFPQKGIKKMEFCSCGAPVPDCEFWSAVIREWGYRRILDIDEYIDIQKKLTSTKNIIASYWALRNPTDSIMMFLEDSRKLYEIIFKLSGSSIIVDSSKEPNKLLILKKIGFDIKVLHLVRRFGDVLNSNKKRVPKNLKAGIEYDVEPRGTIFVLLIWMIKNLSTVIFSKGMEYQKIKYEDFVIKPVKYISKFGNGDVEFIDSLTRRGPFHPKHLVAGNAIRMKENIYIAEKPMDTSYHRLSRIDKIVARMVDFFYK